MPVNFFDKSARDTAVKQARESINPHWRYIVIDREISAGVLTNDIEKAMKELSSNSQYDYVLEIYQASDNSYKTRHIFRKDYHGHLEEVQCSDFLHYDFINQRATPKSSLILSIYSQILSTYDP